MITERETYQILRDDCGFSHYMIRTIVFDKFKSPTWIYVLAKEKKKLISEMVEETQVLAMQCMRDNETLVAKSILSLVWSDRTISPAVCYTIARKAATIVSEAMGFDKAALARLSSLLRPLRVWEARQARKRWTEGNIHTYLAIRGHIWPRIY